ncbi:MAG: sigma 54-interacting transcriptional regulator [Candidatus Sumerlaeia bacterium]|nr:sigma 54-interacting transcriptional regulator [Candidatus Sumerlaeia bacterium]
MTVQTTPAALDPQVMAKLIEASEVLNSSLDLEEVLELFVRISMEVAQCQACSIMLKDPVTGALFFRKSDDPSLVASKPIPPGEGICGAVVQSGEPLLVNNVEEDRRFFAGVDQQTGKKTRSIYALPLKRKRDVIGVLEVINPLGRATFIESDLKPLMILANLATNAVSNAVAHGEVAREAEGLRRSVQGIAGVDFVGRSESAQRLLAVVRRAAQSRATVLVRGESGTGKELIARLLHQLSERASKPLIAVNCGALPEPLLESELFGHEKGAFTGAHARKRGRFELAHGGTLFLDEVGELAPALQVKLLRALQERCFERVGGVETIHVDVRIIAATNRNLEMAVSQGQFREDLYYRLNVIPVDVPPLRQRREDIPHLAQHFLSRCNQHLGRRLEGFTEEAVLALQSAPWRGNIRELENCIERVAVLCDGPRVTLADLPSDLHPRQEETVPASRPTLESGDSLYDIEVKLMIEALEACDWNVSAAARRLKIPRHHLRYRMQKYRIERRGG